VINSNLAPILHRFRDIAVDYVQNRYIWLYTPLVFNSPDGGVSVNFFYRKVMDGQGTKWHKNIDENFNRLSRPLERTNVTDRQTTDDRRQTDGQRYRAYSEHELEFTTFTFAKNYMSTTKITLLISSDLHPLLSMEVVTRILSESRKRRTLEC